jgi:uracil-DNA glycosylase
MDNEQSIKRILEQHISMSANIATIAMGGVALANMMQKSKSHPPVVQSGIFGLIPK